MEKASGVPFEEASDAGDLEKDGRARRKGKREFLMERVGKGDEGKGVVVVV